MNNRQIILKKIHVHNLKGVDLTLNSNELIVFTGVSGSGKSSLAFDTIYVEGQRRYFDSLSHNMKRHMSEFTKPDAEKISGISPTIAIEQKTGMKSPRSTVGTMTGIYDFLRVIFARIGIPYCPVSDEPVAAYSRDKILAKLQEMKNEKVIILAPYAKNKKSSFKEDFADLLKKGFMRIRIDDSIEELTGLEELDPKKPHTVDIVIDRLIIDKDSSSRLSEAIALALEIGKGYFYVLNPDTQEEQIFSEYAYSAKSKKSYGPLSPSDFSFNHPSGMCPKCQGLGEIFSFDLEKIIDPNKSIAEDCCQIASSYNTVRFGNIFDNLASLYDFDIHTPWKKLSNKAKDVFLYGCKKKWTKMHFIHPYKKVKWQEYVQWQGVLFEATKRLHEAKSELYRKKMHSLMSQMICPDCLGQKIKPYPAATRLNNKKIHEITKMSVEEGFLFFSNLSLQKQEKIIAEDLIKEICKRYQFLIDVGLHYLSLDRSSPTLSGGESQRVKLAAQIGCGLTGTTYILDEPSIGLHPVDHTKLISTLKSLKDAGNTVIVVEHDRDTIMQADTIVDVGPKAGIHGGEILFIGSPSEILTAEDSLTGKYLSGKRKIPIPKKRKNLSLKKAIIIKGATHHNLKNIDVKIPLGGLVCITGVSGSGKSSLISDLLYPALFNALHDSTKPVGAHREISGIEKLNKVIFVDQSPIGRTPRSNPATYVQLLGDIRKLFATLPESRMRGLLPGHFSFNVKEGSCLYCKGRGETKVDMDFMEDVFSTCIQCNGKRYDKEILQIAFKEKNIFDVLEMSVEEALDHFSSIGYIEKKLKMLSHVGLDYMKLGQSATTLSGGEAQRIKLAKELVRPDTGDTLYILDEPTTGLHEYDMEHLIQILHKLTDKGNTVLVIEHNMEFVKTADWVIDLGPKGGDAGGKLMASCPVEKIIKEKTPTAKYLKEALLATKKIVPTKVKKQKPQEREISIEKAEQNNLKEIYVKIPHNKISVFTGPSGSGKSSLAFDTIFAESTKRYVDAMPPFMRQFFPQLPKAKVEKISNLSPCIAIEQKGHLQNPRSTVGTMTEIYDLLRLLFTHLGVAYCPETKEKIQTISKEFVCQKILSLPKGEKIQILAPISFLKKETFDQLLERFISLGFLRIRINGKYYELDEKIPFDPKHKNEILLVIDRIVIDSKIESRLLEAIHVAAKIGENKLFVAKEKEDLFFNLSFAVLSTGQSYPEITTQSFSFNSEKGMCKQCLGIGYIYGANIAKDLPIMEMSIEEIFEFFFSEISNAGYRDFLKYFSSLRIDTTVAIEDLTEEEQDLFFNGSDQSISLHKNLNLTWQGLNPILAHAAKHAFYDIRSHLVSLMSEKVCPSCEGSRLNPLSSHVKIGSSTITNICEMEIKTLLDFINSLKVDIDFLKEPFLQIKQRLKLLCEIGVHYLSLNRSAPTLSGGEMQRIRLAKQLGTGLTSCIYVLDEPTIGLHPYNSFLLNSALKKLRDLGNTLILVEHDPMTIEEADYIFDFGPKAGVQGGQITAHGTLDQIKKNKNSLTGQYLSHKKSIPIPKYRRIPQGKISISDAKLHNLQNVSLDIPLHVMSCITGVSGSGKSTLIHQILQPAIKQSLKEKNRLDIVTLDFAKISGLTQIDKLIEVEQSFSSFSIRSDVSTYSEVMPLIRAFFSQLGLAKAKGLFPRHFSFNHKRGMCKTCYGLGYKTVELQFLPPVKVECPTCHGYKLNSISLEVKYKNKHIGQILQMTINEAADFFEVIPKVSHKLQTLQSVGLGYLKLGQELTTLSGGEIQRLRLATEISKRAKKNTIYLFDEPTTGLHSEDIANLLKIFHRLVDKGHTIVMIEHNLDMMANADYIIDIGPDAGKDGGKIMAKGHPEEIAKHPSSHTAKFLKKLL